MIFHLNISNFKKIEKLNLNDFGLINVFVGENDIGKTAVLESIFLISDILYYTKFADNIFGKNYASLIFKKSKFISILNYLTKYFDINSNYNKIIIQSTETNSLPDSKTLEISPNFNEKTGYLDSIDFFLYKKNKEEKISTLTYFITSYMLKFISDNNSYSGIDTLKFDPLKKNCEYISPISLYYDYTIDEEIKIEEKINFEKTIVNTEKKINIDFLKKFDNRIKSMTVWNNHQIYFNLFSGEQLNLFEMSKSFLKILKIITNIIENENGIVLIDEIENGLYHNSQKYLYEIIVLLAIQFNVQLFITTHSFDFIHAIVNASSNTDYFKLFRIEKNNERIDSVSYDFKTLHESILNGWEVR